MKNYIEKSEFARLDEKVENLSTEFHESKKEVISLSKELARETAKFSTEINKLSEILTKIEITIAELVNSNTRANIIRELILKTPRFTITALTLCITFITCSKDIVRLVKSLHIFVTG